MTEVFDELAVIADPFSDEDKIVYLLAGMPESYDVLVTTLESGLDTVPALKNVTEGLLREDKIRRRQMTARNFSWQKQFMCHLCKN